jgi:flagellar basal body rod protein FlgC
MANDIYSTSVSAINAYGALLGKVAHNVANVNTGSFTPLETTMENVAGNGVMALTGTASNVDKVDLSKEAVDRIIAETGIRMNISVLRTAQEEQKSVIDILA